MAKIAVIGSGFGGLAAAIRLQSQGHQVTLFEKRSQAGGRAHVILDQGHVFDAGPTVITAPECLRELFELTGRKLENYVELLPVFPFYRLCWEDGSSFDYSNDLEKVCSQIERFNPSDVLGYQDFLKYSQAVYHEGYTKLVHVPFLNLWSMIKVSPKLLRLRAYRSVYDVVSKYIKDQKLREAFSFHSLLIGGNPFTSSAIYTLIHHLERTGGVFFPKGGTGALVQALVKLFNELGGTLRLNSDVEKILTTKNRVWGVRVDSVDSKFDSVVSNADVTHTYHRLLQDVSGLFLKRKNLARSRYSMSLFLIYFGTNRVYPHLAHHSVIFGPRYKELLFDIFDRGVIADDFSLYLHAPTRTDLSLAPPGHDTFYVLSPVPHLGKAKINWKEKAPAYSKKILDYLEKYHLPDLKKHIVTQHIFTPEDFKSEYHSYLGSAFSLEPVLTQSAYFRIRNQDSKIKNLYFVGAGTHPGAGIPGVVNSAKATVGLMLNELR